MDPLSTPSDQNWTYFWSTDSGFRHTGRSSKLPYLAMKPGIWKMCQTLHMDPLSAPGGSKFSLFSLDNQQFPRYGLILKIPIFVHEAWNLKKAPYKLHMDPLSTPGVEIDLTFTLWSMHVVSEIHTDLQNYLIWAWNLEFEKMCQKFHMDPLSTSRGRNWAHFRSAGSGFRISKLPYWSMKNGIWKKCQKLHMDPLSTTGVEIELIFALRASVFETE